jgi:hypothetical protein
VARVRPSGTDTYFSRPIHRYIKGEKEVRGPSPVPRTSGEEEEGEGEEEEGEGSGSDEEGEEGGTEAEERPPDGAWGLTVRL